MSTPWLKQKRNLLNVLVILVVLILLTSLILKLVAIPKSATSESPKQAEDNEKDSIDSVEWVTYTNENIEDNDITTIGFELQYPSTWTIDSKRKENGDTLYVKLRKGRSSFLLDRSRTK